MKKLMLTALVSTLFSAPALACEAPADRPEIPDPSAAETAQMVKANNDVKEYVKAQEDYLSCADLSSSEKRSAVKKLEKYADTFNEAVREFKLASN